MGSPGLAERGKVGDGEEQSSGWARPLGSPAAAAVSLSASRLHVRWPAAPLMSFSLEAAPYVPRTGTPQGGRLSSSKEAGGRPGGSVLAGRGQHGAGSSPAAEATAACQDATLVQALPSVSLTPAQLPLTPAVIVAGPPQDTQCPAWRSEKEPVRPIFQGFTSICKLHI